VNTIGQEIMRIKMVYVSRMKRVAALLLTLLVAASALSCAMGSEQRYTLPPRLQGSMTDLEADLFFLIHELPKRHERIYHTVDRETYKRAASELLYSISDMDADHAAVAIRTLVAMIGDAHTSYSAGMREAVPLNLIYLDQGDSGPSGEGMFVTADTLAGEGTPVSSLVREDEKGPAAAELIRIGALEVFPTDESDDSVYDRVRTIVSHENEHHIRQQLNYLLLDPAILYGLDIISDRQSVTMTFLINEEEQEVTFTPVPTSRIRELDWMVYYDDVTGFSGHDRTVLPTYLEYANDHYAAVYEDGTLHIMYNSCSEDPELKFSTFVQGLKDYDPEQVVIDLRHNGGGNSRLIRPLYDYLDGLSDEAALYTVISPATFSSGLMNAIELDQRYERMVLIGRPTGGKPNHYGEVCHIQLPSGAYLYWSSNYFVNDAGNDALTLEPEHPIPISAETFFALEDPVLEYVKDPSSP
jgi:hypothetical protein